MSKLKIILSFDLDNTLINNREGIFNSFQYVFNKYHLPKIKKKKLEKTIGIPLQEVFHEITSIDSKILISDFREYYGKEGIHQGKLLLGVREKLEELDNYGFVLGIITSKKQEMAVKITKILGIFEYFKYIIGESEEIKSKLDPNLKNHLLKEYPDNKFIIIGDHPKDKALADILNVPFIGVLTGNHTAKELSQKNPKSNSKVVILNNVSEITPNIIYGLLK